MDWQTQLLAGLVTVALGTIVTANTIFKGVLQAWGNRLILRIQMTDAAYVSALDQVGSYDSVFMYIRKLKYVDRVMLLKGENGGGVPKPGSDYTVCSTFGYSSIDGNKPEEIYKSPFPVDKHYVDMLVGMINTGMVVMTKSEMPKGCILRDFYDEEGVFQSLVFFVKIDKQDATLRFFSVANYTRAFTDSEITHLRILAARIRAIATTGADPGTALQTPVK